MSQSRCEARESVRTGHDIAFAAVPRPHRSLHGPWSIRRLPGLGEKPPAQRHANSQHAPRHRARPATKQPPGGDAPCRQLDTLAPLRDRRASNRGLAPTAARRQLTTRALKFPDALFLRASVGCAGTCGAGVSHRRTFPPGVSGAPTRGCTRWCDPGHHALHITSTAAASVAVSVSQHWELHSACSKL